MLIRRGAACPSKSIRWHSDRSSPPQSVRMKWVISSSLCFTSMNTFSVMLRACVTAPLVGNCMSHALWVVRQIVISWNCYCQYDVRIFVTKVETVSYALAKLSLTSTSTWVCSNAARVYHRAGWKKIFCVSRLAVGRAKIALRVFEKKIDVMKIRSSPNWVRCCVICKIARLECPCNLELPPQVLESIKQSLSKLDTICPGSQTSFFHGKNPESQTSFFRRKIPGECRIKVIYSWSGCRFPSRLSGGWEVLFGGLGSILNYTYPGKYWYGYKIPQGPMSDDHSYSNTYMNRGLSICILKGHYILFDRIAFTEVWTVDNSNVKWIMMVTTVVMMIMSSKEINPIFLFFKVLNAFKCLRMCICMRTY